MPTPRRARVEVEYDGIDITQELSDGTSIPDVHG